MVAETPADRLERVYVSESFYRHPPELRGLDLSKALIVDDQVFRQVSDTQTPQGIMAVVRQQENSLESSVSTVFFTVFPLSIFSLRFLTFL